MRFAFIALVILALAACASPEPETTQVVAVTSTPQSSHLECHQEAALGSNVIHKVCQRTLSDTERAVAQEAIANKLHEMSRTTLPKGD